jgi:hypothetical protein
MSLKPKKGDVIPAAIKQPDGTYAEVPHIFDGKEFIPASIDNVLRITLEMSISESQKSSPKDQKKDAKKAETTKADSKHDIVYHEIKSSPEELEMFKSGFKSFSRQSKDLGIKEYDIVTFFEYCPNKHPGDMSPHGYTGNKVVAAVGFVMEVSPAEVCFTVHVIDKTS